MPILSHGDLIIDAGNSKYQDTVRRCDELQKLGLLFIGSGIGGGEEDARNGLSLMPGGHKEAWPLIKDIFQTISAKTDNMPCCDWVGEGGAGHFAKMVHDSIQYGDMQLISEAYDLLKALSLSQREMAETFNDWNKCELESFLIKITSDILSYKDDQGYVLERIRDTAGQKGTGKQAAVSALHHGVPVTLVGAAVFSRCLSVLKDERVYASKHLSRPSRKITVANRAEFLNHIKNALYCSKIVSYAQGFMLLREGAKENKWNLNYGSIALMWRGGCIIRSALLDNIKEAFTRNPQLSNLLLDDFFKAVVERSQESWRRVVCSAVLWGIPVPALSAALAFYDGYRAERLPANLLQAQYDYLDALAHT